jgi:hypothetical protein
MSHNTGVGKVNAHLECEKIGRVFDQIENGGDENIR